MCRPRSHAALNYDASLGGERAATVVAPEDEDLEETPLGLVCAPGTDCSVLSVVANGWDSVVVPYEHPILRFLSFEEAAVFRSVCS